MKPEFANYKTSIPAQAGIWNGLMRSPIKSGMLNLYGENA